MSEHAREVYLEDIKEMFASYTDEELHTQFDEAMSSRDWYSCDFISDELERRLVEKQAPHE